jgi:hypothetical protein
MWRSPHCRACCYESINGTSLNTAARIAVGTRGCGTAILDETLLKSVIMPFMIALNAHYDGKVIVPDEPLSLKPDQKLRISIETIDAEFKPRTKFSDWIGIGLPLPENHTPRFSSNDELWEKDK